MITLESYHVQSVLSDIATLASYIIGTSLSEPHIYVMSVNFVCLSVSLSVGPYVYAGHDNLQMLF